VYDLDDFLPDYETTKAPRVAATRSMNSREKTLESDDADEEDEDFRVDENPKQDDDDDDKTIMMTSKKTTMNGPICRRPFANATNLVARSTPACPPDYNAEYNDDEKEENTESTRQAYGRCASTRGVVAGQLSLGQQQQHQQQQP
jgi:hypothetical protein